MSESGLGEPPPATESMRDIRAKNKAALDMLRRYATEPPTATPAASAEPSAATTTSAQSRPFGLPTTALAWLGYLVIAFAVGYGATHMSQAASLVTAFVRPAVATQARPAPSRAPATMPPAPTPRPAPDAAQLRVLVTSVGADALADEFRGQLPRAWQEATRGLGRLEIVTPSRRAGGPKDGAEDGSTEWDVRLYAVAGAGVSNDVGRTAGSRAVVYEHDPQSRQGWQNGEVIRVAVALQELAHTWCCYGDGTFEGHWLTTAPAPGLMNQYWFVDPRGVPRFGLAFSDRELVAMRLLRR